MCWGDVKLKETADDEEYLEFNERQTKTRTGSDCRGNPAISPSTSESQQSMALFGGAVIQGGNFSISINTVNQSPKLTLQESSPPEALPRWKRLRPLQDSDDE